MAIVVYLCSPNPHVIKHTQERSNLNSKVHLAVDRVIERSILMRRDHTPENKENVQADLMENSGRSEMILFAGRGVFQEGTSG